MIGTSEGEWIGGIIAEDQVRMEECDQEVDVSGFNQNLEKLTKLSLVIPQES